MSDRLERVRRRWANGRIDPQDVAWLLSIAEGIEEVKGRDESHRPTRVSPVDTGTGVR